MYVFVPGTVAATGNPLVAQYSIATFPGSAVTVQFGPTQSYGLKTWAVPAAASGATSVLVAGMKNSSTYHLQGLVQLADGTQFTDTDKAFTTGALPSGLAPNITTMTAPGATPASGIELLQLYGGSEANLAAADLQGNVIWYYNYGSGSTIPDPAKILPNGHILVNYENTAVGDGADSVLQEIDLAGNIVWQMTAANLNQALASAGINLTVVGTHHDFAVLPNGHLILVASMYQSSNVQGYSSPVNVLGDVLIDLNSNHVPVWTWSSFDYLDVNRQVLNFPDWTHTNAVLYSPSDGDLVISMRDQSWLIKIDYDNGAGTGGIVWKLGAQGNFTLMGGSDPYDWFYAEHFPYFVNPETTSGNYEIGVFDNDNNAPTSSGTCGTSGAPACESRVQIYQIDESAQTATIAWQDELVEYSFWGGAVETLLNNDIEFDECTTNGSANAAVYEVTPTSSPQTVWQMQISGQNAYRALRIPSLYPGVQW
jgi:hypothetical protein